MQPLDRTLRSQLEQTVKQARIIAEKAARVVLEHLGVDQAAPFPYLSENEKELRRKLRVHGRQLGDSLNGDKVQRMDRLIEETGYQHWHRMLFARYLAENNLLMYPDPHNPVPISLDECEELAADEGAENGWELAARYAAGMLPRIFRPDSPVFQLSFPPEHQQSLEGLLGKLSAEVFTASDSLGWVYQFWQSDNKDRINKAEEKIGARELPAVTQLFTEPYMVSFLLDNSLGAWWAARRLSEEDLENASSEEELREKAAIPGVPLTYLRFVQREDSEGKRRWIPAAGTYGAWPKSLAELKMLDPCCGSGHFLVATFLMLVPMRMEAEGLTVSEAVDAVLRENIHGLELDPRCVELAVFALALTAWTYPGAGGYRTLPELNVACSGLSVSLAKEEWKQLGLGKGNLAIALDGMHDIFRNAPILGSLVNPAKSEAAGLVKWEELSESLEQALEQEQVEEKQEVAVVAQGLARAANLLAKQYTLVITNVPYLARGKQDEILRKFADRYYPEGRNDLATIFLDRCLDFCVEGGTASIVLPQNWLFLTSYRKFREKLLKNETWHLVARLGPQAFQTPMWDFNVQLLSLSRGNVSKGEDDLFGRAEEGPLLRGLDVSEPRRAEEKAAGLLTAEIKTVRQMGQLENPDARVTLESLQFDKLLSSISESHHGLTTGDTFRMKLLFWEIVENQNIWIPFQSTVEEDCLFGGNKFLLRWDKGENAINELLGARKDGILAWGRKGIVVSQMGSLCVSQYLGSAFDNNTAVVTPFNQKNFSSIWCFCSSPEYSEEVRKIDQKLAVTSATLVKVPFDLERWTKVAEEQYPNGLPKPYSDDPTQWIFHGHPCGSVIWDEGSKWTGHGKLRTDESVLQVAVARLLGYRWPAELDAEMELADEQREWVRRCDDLSSHADSDGIVCIPAVRGEAAADSRLLNLLAAAYGDAWSNQVLAQLLSSADHAGKPLETWLREKFFAQHCRIFGNRPFIWQIWDGLRDGFSALLNYHKLDYRTLETLAYTYLGDWINRQKQDRADGVDGAEEKLIAAESLQKKLLLILKGEAPYDIFVRWKPLEEQPIGWNPDLNDGVRLNIRPFMMVPDVRRKGAGILRDKPNIHWKKDRGKDVESAPWYHLGPEYGGTEGDRINEHHLRLEEKEAARSRIGMK